MRNLRLMFGAALSCVIMILSGSLGVAAQDSSGILTATLLASELKGGSGSAVGPDGALYIPEYMAGIIDRVDPATGEKTVFASGLPKMMIENWEGGIMDVTFLNDTAYAMVTLVSADVGGTDVDGIYRIDGPDSFTVIADLGKWSTDHPPKTEIEVPTGVQYAIDVYKGNFIITDGHHNRVLQVTPDGDITEMIAFDDVVPTGLMVSESTDTIFVTEAGPVPHLPAHGKVMSFMPGDSTATEVASGAPLMLGVKLGSGDTLYAISQGYFAPGNLAGTAAQTNTGSLVRVNSDGTVTVVADGLNQPTSMEIIGDSAYVVTLSGEVWKVDGI